MSDIQQLIGSADAAIEWCETEDATLPIALTIHELRTTLTAQAQEIERVAEQRDVALMKAEGLKELEQEARLQLGDAVDREELVSNNNNLLLGENADLRARAEAAETDAKIWRKRHVKLSERVMAAEARVRELEQVPRNSKILTYVEIDEMRDTIEAKMFTETRERCAQVADHYFSGRFVGDKLQVNETGAHQIAATIRALRHDPNVSRP